jgi:hypothetical protein
VRGIESIGAQVKCCVTSPASSIPAETFDSEGSARTPHRRVADLYALLVRAGVVEIVD